MKHPEFDVVVVGAGHAGVEAADAACRAGARTALVTLRRDDLGVMSCNPAIGGLGKGHLVREIDALGGVMGRAADASAIQYRLLNRSKGAAVQGPRAQTDRALYRAAVAKHVFSVSNMTVLEAEVADLAVGSEHVQGVVLADGTIISARAVVLTTGTFLRGVIHVGNQSKSGGRHGASPSVRLAERMRDMGLSMGRLKTGTPPRLDGRTIAWEGLESQSTDDDPMFLSFMTDRVQVCQIACGITHTNAMTHDIIRNNLNRSAMYGGHIESVGPRYCPSIEDKIVRFSDKSSHQIFLEPEGLNSDVIYPNGISTSMPEEVQVQYVRSIRGLEQAVITQPGYAIEYDYVDPTSLSLELELRQLSGLFLAGQINGTTGYEEAAAQGLVAGLNSAFYALDQEGIRFDRRESYIGVLIDDLVTRGVSEPYRMFTSRAEYRLSLRVDNADQRLSPVAIARGLLRPKQAERFQQKMERLCSARDWLERLEVTPNAATTAGLAVSQDGRKRSGMDLLAFPHVTVGDLAALVPDLSTIDANTARQLKIEAGYAVYVERQQRDTEAMKRDEEKMIPSNFSYSDISGLSNELKSKLTRVQPSTLGQASRIDGMTPVALALILTNLRLTSRSSA